MRVRIISQAEALRIAGDRLRHVQLPLSLGLDNAALRAGAYVLERQGCSVIGILGMPGQITNVLYGELQRGVV